MENVALYEQERDLDSNRIASDPLKRTLQTYGYTHEA